MKRTKFVAIGGFLGAGKTTTVLKALVALQARGLRGAYIANDQGEGLVDTELARAMQVEAKEVLGGCFCCRFDDLIATANRVVESFQPDIILAEAVGSCTDLIATVVNPLKMHHARRFEVAPYTVVVDPDRFSEMTPGEGQGELDYLFGKQLEEAQIVALNKIDLLSEASLAQLADQLQVLAPRAEIVACSAQAGTRIDQLLSRWLGEASTDATALELDYDTYAAAEASLAWLNATLRVSASRDKFRPEFWVRQLLTDLQGSLRVAGARIGHLKLVLRTDGGFTKASITGTEGEINISYLQSAPASKGEVLINARAEAEPERLEGWLQDAVTQADKAAQVTSQFARSDAFSPSRPQPTHRLEYDGSRLTW